MNTPQTLPTTIAPATAEPPFPRMHVSCYVSDIQKTVEFYNRLFNVLPVKQKEDYAKYILDKPSLIISFVENADKIAPGFGHLGFQLATQEEVFDRMVVVKNAGLSVTEELGTACCYAVQDKFWVSDPDGYMWEVYYFHEDAEFNDPRYADGSSSVCCMPKTKVKISLSDLIQKPV